MESVVQVRHQPKSFEIFLKGGDDVGVLAELARVQHDLKRYLCIGFETAFDLGDGIKCRELLHRGKVALDGFSDIGAFQIGEQTPERSKPTRNEELRRRLLDRNPILASLLRRNARRLAAEAQITTIPLQTPATAGLSPLPGRR